MQPWANKFAIKDMETFFLKNIIPKLEEILINLEIQSPEIQQSVQSVPWDCMHAWEALLPTHMMVQLLYKCFFTKWYEVLDKLLRRPTLKRNLNEVVMLVYQLEEQIQPKIIGGTSDKRYIDY